LKILELTEKGLYCPPAKVYIDPWRPVDKAIITHAHSDHARWGMKSYLAHEDSREILKLRLGQDIVLETLPYRKEIKIGDAFISLYPAGHIPGSAQIKIRYKGKILVISGDYKTEDDHLSQAFEPVPCHEFVSECTFGLPIFQWQNQNNVYKDINHWWLNNSSLGINSVCYAYSLGKAQRLLKALDSSIGEILVHGSIWNTNEALKANGFQLPNVKKVNLETNTLKNKGVFIIAPPSAEGSNWLNKLHPYRTAICSGWMNVRGNRKRRAVDAGFVLSDHADWKGLIQAIQATGAEKVYLTHGYTAPLAKYLNEEEKINAVELQTLFEGDEN
jgi:putative mRNA 3-end processing factor